jgi:hypothetical protein
MSCPIRLALTLGSDAKDASEGVIEGVIKDVVEGGIGRDGTVDEAAVVSTPLSSPRPSPLKLKTSSVRVNATGYVS